MKLHKLYDLCGLTEAHKKSFKELCDSLLSSGYGFLLDELGTTGLVIQPAEGVVQLGVQPAGAYRQMFCTETGLWYESNHICDLFPVPEKRIFHRYDTSRMNSWNKKCFQELCDTLKQDTGISLLNQLTTVLWDADMRVYLLATVENNEVTYLLTDTGLSGKGSLSSENLAICDIPPVKESVYRLEETLLWQKQYHDVLSTAVANFEQNSDLRVQEKRKAVFKLT